MADEEPVVVYEAEDEVQAILHRELLEEAGISVFEDPLEQDEFLGVKLMYSQLLVPKEDAGRARELIDAFDAEANAGELETPDEPMKEDS